MSTTSTHRRVLRHEGAGIDRARATTKPVTGETDDGVAEVDAQLVEARLRLRGSARARGRAAPPPTGSAPRCRRASASAAAAARTGCASARRWSRASFRSASRWRMVASETCCAASACLTCSWMLEVLDLGDPLAAGDAVAEAHGDTSRARPAARGATATVASPIRLPTTVICWPWIVAREAFASSTVSGGRPNWPPPKPPPPPAAAPPPPPAARGCRRVRPVARGLILSVAARPAPG